MIYICLDDSRHFSNWRARFGAFLRDGRGSCGDEETHFDVLAILFFIASLTFGTHFALVSYTIIIIIELGVPWRLIQIGLN